jgi:hypothetical protein
MDVFKVREESVKSLWMTEMKRVKQSVHRRVRTPIIFLVIKNVHDIILEVDAL